MKKITALLCSLILCACASLPNQDPLTINVAGIVSVENSKAGGSVRDVSKTTAHST